MYIVRPNIPAIPPARKPYLSQTVSPGKASSLGAILSLVFP